VSIYQADAPCQMKRTWAALQELLVTPEGACVRLGAHCHALCRGSTAYSIGRPQPPRQAAAHPNLSIYPSMGNCLSETLGLGAFRLLHLGPEPLGEVAARSVVYLVRARIGNAQLIAQHVKQSNRCGRRPPPR
jgi:hypothetical protein